MTIDFDSAEWRAYAADPMGAINRVSALMDAAARERDEVTAAVIAGRLLKDVQGRFGFAKVWDEIEDSVKAEIADRWVRIVLDSMHPTPERDAEYF